MTVNIFFEMNYVLIFKINKRGVIIDNKIEEILNELNILKANVEEIRVSL